MTKVSPKHKEIIRQAYALKDFALEIGAANRNLQAQIAFVSAGEIDSAIRMFKKDKDVAVFMAAVAAVAPRIDSIAAKTPKANELVNLNVVSSSVAFSGNVSPTAERTNKDVKPGKVKTYTGRDAIRRTNSARTKDQKTGRRLLAHDYESTKTVTQTPQQLSDHANARLNRQNHQTDTAYNPAADTFKAAKTEAPTAPEAIAANAIKAAKAKARRNSVKAVRPVKGI